MGALGALSRRPEHFVVSHHRLQLQEVLLVLRVVPGFLHIVACKLTDHVERVPKCEQQEVRNVALDSADYEKTPRLPGVFS